MTAGGLVLTRLVSAATRDWLTLPLAIIATATLMAMFADPGLPLVLVIFDVSGSAAAFTIPLNAVFVRRVDLAYRGRAVGLAIAGLTGVQGLGFQLADAGVEAGMSPATVTASCGLVGAVAMVLAGLAWRPNVVGAAVAPAADRHSSTPGKHRRASPVTPPWR
jgi:hypothetical protein